MIMDGWTVWHGLSIGWCAGVWTMYVIVRIRGRG